MNARQKAKKYKKKISILKSDNDLMRRIIADSPTMQELYDAYNKLLNTTHTTMQFQKYQSKRVLYYPNDPNSTTIIAILKQELAKNLFEDIKENITYEVDAECLTPTITASIFIGRRVMANENIERRSYRGIKE